MRKIKIDKNLQDEANVFCNTLFSNRDSSFVSPRIKLQKLKAKIRSRRHIAYKNYVQRIIDRYLELLKADPDEMIFLLTNSGMIFQV